MGDKSNIQWTEATWNPVTGCSKVSPGCAHCYAETLTARYAGSPGWIGEHRPWTPENAAHNVRLRPERLDQPLRWRRPRLVFVNSMSDLFHELVPDAYIEEVFGVMGQAQQHTFQVLTKRPERMRDLLQAWSARGERPLGLLSPAWPLPNVWLGTSIENRRFVDRADLLRGTPAAVRFISAEPLLGPLLMESRCNSGCREVLHWSDDHDCSQHDLRELDLAGIDWLIVGGESGPGHRPMEAQWVRDLRDASQRDHNDIIGPRSGGRFPLWDLHGTRFFFKQWGGATPKSGGRELDRRTWDEMPVVEASLAAA